MKGTKLEVFVLMPFNSELSFVYQKLDSLTKDIGNKNNMQLNIERGDEFFSHKRDKVDEIIQKIKDCDLVILDLSYFKPNIIWEFGYSLALNKNIIVIQQKSDNIQPFMFHTHEVIFYDLSVAGLLLFEKKIYQNIENKLEKLKKFRSSLINDYEIRQEINGLITNLTKFDQSSILRNFVKNEIMRISNNINKLSKGNFYLRNKKPISEIIDYYCEYLRQLDNAQCSYDTISFKSFWLKITNYANDFRYLDENKVAASRGTKIRRIFLFNLADFPSKNISKDKSMAKILERHFDNLIPNFEIKLYFSPNLRVDLNTYENYALWKKGQEIIMFRPEYDAIDQDMNGTAFNYCNLQTGQQKEIYNSYRSKQQIFNSLWLKSENLEEKHFLPEK